MRRHLLILLLLGSGLITMTGGMAATAAPFPTFEKKTPQSDDFVVLDRPDDRPIKGVEPIGISGERIVGTDEALYLYTDHHYIKTLHHMVWQMFRAGDFVYAVVNPYHRKSMHASRILYRTGDGRNWQRISGKRGTSATLFAVDTTNDVVYGANSTGGYNSSLYKRNLRTGKVATLGAKILRDIKAIGWFKGKLYVASNGKKLYVSHDDGQSFIDSSSKLTGGKNGAANILTNEHYLLISIARHWLYRFDGKTWDEIASKTVKYGGISLYQIHYLKEHQLVFDRGFKRHYVMDLRTKKVRRIHLPEVYQYPVYTLSGEDLIVAAQLPKDGVLRVVSGSEPSYEKQEKAGQLLRVRLAPEPCHKVIGNYRAIGNYLAPRGLVIDSGRVIINNGKELLEIPSNQRVNGNRFDIANGFKQGAVNGDWFIRMIPEGSGDAKEHHHLRQSSDQGKGWKTTGNKLQEKGNAVIDDSLQVAYFMGVNNVWRTSIKPGDEHNYAQEVFEGKLETLIVDKTSRVWVQSSQGLFVSQRTGGWWQSPLPFRDNHKIAIRGFALLTSHMAVTYRDQLYLSRNDTGKWKPYPIIDPCTQQHLPVRVVGYADNHIILLDRLYGHIWVLNPNNGHVQHCQIDKTNGVVRKAHLVGDMLLVQTSGTLLQYAHGEWKGAASPRLLLFNLKN